MRLQAAERFAVPLGRAGRKKIAVAVAVFAAALALDLLIALFIHRPAGVRLDHARNELGGLKRRHAEALLFQKQKKAAAGISAGILLQKDVPILIKEVVQTARRRSLKVGVISSDLPAPGKEGMVLLTFLVPAHGSYPDIKRFIYDIETFDRPVGIQAIELKAEKQGIAMDMKLVTYVRVDAAGGR